MSTVVVSTERTTKEIEILADCKAVPLVDRSKIPPFCLTGGKSGSCRKEYLIRQGKKHKLPAKGTFDLLKGDILCIETPGGGGNGKES